MKQEQPYRRLVSIKHEIAQRKNAVNSTFTKFSKKLPQDQSFMDKRQMDLSLVNATDQTDKENSRMKAHNEDFQEDAYDFKKDKEMVKSNSTKALMHLGQARVFKKHSVHIDLTSQPLNLKEHRSHRNLSANRSDSSINKSKGHLGYFPPESPRQQQTKTFENQQPKKPIVNPLIDTKNALLSIIKRMHNLEVEVNESNKRAMGIIQISRQARLALTDNQVNASSLIDSKIGTGFTIEETIKSQMDHYLIKTQEAATYDGDGKLYNPNFKPTLQMQYVLKIEQQLQHSGSINLEYWKYYKGQFKNSKKHGKGVLILAGDFTVQGEWNQDYLEDTIEIYDNYHRLVGRQTLCRAIHTPSITE